MTPEQIRLAWEAAYRATEYRVELAQGEMVLRVEVNKPEQDRRLREEAGVRACWAIVTPCNPESRPLAPAENAALLQQLEQLVARLGLRAIPSRNRDPRGEWPDEPGFLLCDPPPGLAEELGRRFRQNAILAATLGEAPRLAWLNG